jgi:hypothetical protein
VRTTKLFYPEDISFVSQFTLSKRNYSASAVGPHAAITRNSITIPTGRRGLLVNGFILMMRDAAPTTAGVARAAIEVTGVDVVSEIREITATTGVPRINHVPRGDVFEPGETISLITADGSTGGSYTYVISLAVILGSISR